MIQSKRNRILTGNITSAFDSTLNPAGIPALDPAFDDALFP